MVGFFLRWHKENRFQTKVPCTREYSELAAVQNPVPRNSNEGKKWARMTLTVLVPPCTGSLLPGTTVRATPGAAYFTHSEHKEVKLKLSGWDGRNSGKIIPGFFSFLVPFQPFLSLHGHMSILAATGNFLESL